MRAILSALRTERQPLAMAEATSRAASDPLKESGAMTTERLTRYRLTNAGANAGIPRVRESMDSANPWEHPNRRQSRSLAYIVVTQRVGEP